MLMTWLGELPAENSRQLHWRLRSLTVTVFCGRLLWCHRLTSTSWKAVALSLRCCWRGWCDCSAGCHHSGCVTESEPVHQSGGGVWAESTAAETTQLHHLLQWSWPVPATHARYSRYACVVMSQGQVPSLSSVKALEQTESTGPNQSPTNIVFLHLTMNAQGKRHCCLYASSPTPVFHL